MKYPSSSRTKKISKPENIYDSGIKRNSHKIKSSLKSKKATKYCKLLLNSLFRKYQVSEDLQRYIVTFFFTHYQSLPNMKVLNEFQSDNSFPVLSKSNLLEQYEVSLSREKCGRDKLIGLSFVCKVQKEFSSNFYYVYEEGEFYRALKRLMKNLKLNSTSNKSIDWDGFTVCPKVQLPKAKIFEKNGIKYRRNVVPLGGGKCWSSIMASAMRTDKETTDISKTDTDVGSQSSNTNPKIPVIPFANEMFNSEDLSDKSSEVLFAGLSTTNGVVDVEHPPMEPSFSMSQSKYVLHDHIDYILNYITLLQEDLSQFCGVEIKANFFYPRFRSS